MQGVEEHNVSIRRFEHMRAVNLIYAHRPRISAMSQLGAVYSLDLSKHDALQLMTSTGALFPKPSSALM